jgi:hypothetical protein
MFRPLLAAVALGLALLAVPGSSFSQVQTIEIKTGQSGGAPGSCGSLDDCFRYLTAPGCGSALSGAAFTAADFTAAQSGPFAALITPHPAWGTALACDPDARWINSAVAPGSCLGDAASVLYACPFEVTGPCTTATIDVCWLVDDALGDLSYGGANPIGVYVNGVALDASFTAGSYAVETSSSAAVSLTTGTNWLYVYQRDAGCAVSGLMLHATIRVECPVSVEDESWGRVKALFR